MQKNRESVLMLSVMLISGTPLLALAGTQGVIDQSSPPIGSNSIDTSAISDPADGAVGEPPSTIPVNAPETQDRHTAEKVGEKNRLVEEIIVTAQKHEERIQDVPLSIQAFSGDALAARGIENTKQLGQSVPSLQFTEVGGFTLLYIRGIGTDNFVPSADPSIATYIDGIYLPQGQGTVQAIGDVKRIEVLKGPQGTLFGRNSTGGAISIVDNEPSSVLKASAEGEIGNFEDRSIKASVSGPILGDLYAGVSGVISHKNDYYTDTNFKVPPDDLEAVRLQLAWHPSDHLALGLTGYHSTQQNVGSLIGKNTSPSDLGTALLITPETDDYHSQVDTKGESKSSQNLFYGHLNWDLPWVDLKFLGSGQSFLIGPIALDFDGSPMPIAQFGGARNREKQNLQTGELQILSNDNTWAHEKFKWIAGLYYFHSIAGFDPAELKVGAGAFNAIQNELGVSLPQGLTDFAKQLSIPLLQNGLDVRLAGLLGTKSYSAYTQGTYFITDWVDLTLGGRFQFEKRFLTKSQTTVADPVAPGDPTLFNFPLQHATSSNFSPKAVLSFHLGENELVYASYAVGFKSGTYNIVNIYEAPNYIVPEQVKTYELGAKVDLLHGLLRLNGALFDNQIKNLQSGFVSLLSGGAVSFNTVPSARTRGAEFDGTLVPLPSLDDGLALTANAAYVDAIYTDYPCGPGFNKTTGVYQSCLNFDGHQIVRAPKLSGGLGLVQTIDLTPGSLEFAADEYYNSGFYYDPFNTVKETPYAILNARVGYLYTPWNFRVTAFTKNLLDRRYHIAQLQTDFGVTKTLAAPREYGIRINWDF